MIHILYGEDDFSISQSLEKIKAGLGDQTLLMANTTTIDGKQVTLDQLRTACDAVPFLAEKRLVIITGLLERFELKGRPGGKKKIAQVSNQQDGYKLLAGYISNIPDSTIVVLLDGQIRSSNPLLKELSPKAEVRPFFRLRDAKLRQWVQKHVDQEGGSISPTAIDLLTKLVGGNLWIMASEINKLVLFASGRRIETEDVKQVVSHVEQANVFAMVDAILDFKSGEAERLLQQLLQRGAAPVYILTMLSRQVRMIVQVKELKSRVKSRIEIQHKLGITSEFVVRKTLELVGRYSWERLKQVYRKLLDTDLSIKTGKYEGELALNILIAELCQSPASVG